MIRPPNLRALSSAAGCILVIAVACDRAPTSVEAPEVPGFNRLTAGQGVVYNWHAGGPFLALAGIDPAGLPLTAFSAGAERIELTGDGVLRLHPKAASGGGQFVHRNAAGDVVGGGSWEVVGLRSFQSYGASDDLPHYFEAGKAILDVTIIPDGGAPHSGTLALHASLPGGEGDDPRGSVRGMELRLDGGTNFDRPQRPGRRVASNGGAVVFARHIDLHVAGQTGDDANPGTRAQPFRTIQRGIDATDEVLTTVLRVLVAGGTYPGSLALRSDVHAFGGFDPASWTRDAALYETTIVGDETAVALRDVNAVTLDGFTIVSADATAPGGSSIGISLHDAEGVVLSNNRVRAGRGAAGTDGEPGESIRVAAKGTDGFPAAFGGPTSLVLFIAAVAVFGEDAEGAVELLGWTAGLGGSGAGPRFDNYSQGPGGHGASGGCGQIHISGLDFDTSPGGAGNDGQRDFSGLGGAGGLGGLGGESSGNTLIITRGTDGEAGDIGGRGANGASGAPFGALAEGGYIPADGGDGQRGLGGGGGGGGGSASGAMSLGFTPLCGSGGGGGGQGGEGGMGGTGGTGGGGSFGILATGTGDVAIVGNEVTTSAGGLGGRAGFGGAGAPGGLGGSYGVTTTIGIFDPMCVIGEPSTKPPFLGCGGFGGEGGFGGNGGRGGFGGNGPSVDIATGAGVTVIHESDP